LFGFAVTIVLRKIGVKIRPVYSLCIIGTLTGILYIHLYRPDIFINSVTGGYFGFLESRPEQLNLAIRFGDVETVQSLLKNDPDLVFSKSRNITGSTPLHEAAFRGQSSIARLLLADGASINTKGSFGDTPLFASAFMGYVGTVELLLKNGAKVDIKNDNGETPLYVAAEYGHKRIVELLLASKADVNAKSNNGSTPVLAAAASGDVKTVQLLIVSNAEINVTNDMGQTPLYMAAGNGNKDVAELLRQHGATNN
jgi:ankyrin repeat protein